MIISPNNSTGSGECKVDFAIVRVTSKLEVQIKNWVVASTSTADRLFSQTVTYAYRIDGKLTDLPSYRLTRSGDTFKKGNFNFNLI